MGGKCRKIYLLVVPRGIKNAFQFNEGFLKIYSQDHDKGYFLEVDVQYQRMLHQTRMIYDFYRKE